MMRKQLLLLFILLLPLCLLSQDIERIIILGKVTAPVGEDIEGITIYNVSSQKGTVTSPEGLFDLTVAENDRVSVTALQFSSFIVIVDKGVIENKKMGIYLNPVVNQLEEVIVRPYDLLGNITADVNKIKTANVVPQWDLSYESLEYGYEFSADEMTSIKGNKAEEAYFNGPRFSGGDIIGLAAGLASLLLPKKKKKTFKEINEDKNYVARSLRQRFSNSYLLSNFGIEEEQANEFIYYVEENGMQSIWLKEENEIRLLDFMYQKSKDFKSLRE
ncbi:MAG: hypothetical protein ACI83B_004170 [Sediminicola sp.]|jgi:hypothetical protein|tara:strand:- start:2857 stop:3678 length:822 start_codon:yes stop_codon:yes gene_type:complete